MISETTTDERRDGFLMMKHKAIATYLISNHFMLDYVKRFSHNWNLYHLGFNSFISENTHPSSATPLHPPTIPDIIMQC